MSSANADITWTADDSAVMRVWQRMEQNQLRMARGFDQIKTASDRSAKAAETGWSGVATALRGTATALIGGGSILTAFDMIREVNRKALEEAQEANKEFDKLFRSFRVQAGLNAIEGDQAKGRILDLATRNAVREDVAVAGARGLVGAGFTTEDATGAALGELLRARAATNATGGTADDLEGLSTSVAAYLQSQGMEKNAGNLGGVLRGAFALRQTGAFELSDLTELGKHGAALRGHLSQEEQLAAFGTLVDQMPSAEAATSLRNIVSRLSTSRTGRTSVQALTEIGLKPEDVDLHGEDFGTVMGRLQQGLDKIPEQNRASVLKLLFEEAGVAPARALMAERDGRYREYRESQRGVGGAYDEAVKVAQSGREAAEARLGVQANTAKAADDAGDNLVLAAMELEHRERGIGEFSRKTARFMYNQARWFGASQETALGLGLYKEGGDPTEFPRAVLQRAQDAAGGEKPAPKFTTAGSIEARERREAELEQLEAEWWAARDAPRGGGGNGMQRLGRGFSNSGRGGLNRLFRKGPTEAQLDAFAAQKERAEVGRVVAGVTDPEGLSRLIASMENANALLSEIAGTNRKMANERPPSIRQPPAVLRTPQSASLSRSE